jgi:hypothetical protein
LRAAIRPKDIVLRPEAFRLVKVEGPNVPTVLRRIATLDSPFLSVVREEQTLSLLIAEADAKRIAEVLNRATVEPTAYRVITFTPTLPWTLVGFMARVTTALAEGGIPLGALSSFDRDHVFVRDELAARSVEILKDAARDGRLH